MTWQIPVVLNIIFAYCLLQFMIKKIAAHGSRTRKLVWQYFFSALAAIIAILVLGIDISEKGVVIVMVIGVFNALACYSHWRAFDISMSRTSLFTQVDDLTALLLGFVVLGEAKFLNGILGLGLLLSLVSVFLFSFAHREKSEGNKMDDLENSKKKYITVWIAICSVIWGVAAFSMRYFSLGGMSLPTYLVSWYLGSFVGSILVFIFAGKKERGEPLEKKEIVKVALLAVVLWICLGLEYWSRTLAPIAVSQPIFQVSEMVLPTLIGLWIFKENKNLNLLSWIAIVIGLIGGITIALSY